MRRRRVLAGVAALPTLSGCLFSAPRREERGGRAAGPTATAQLPVNPELPVPKGDLRAAAPRDAIPAITDPAFAPDWSGVSITRDGEAYEPRLRPEEPVIGVDRAGEARAYPLQVLTWHEAVNDRLDGPLLVTYCPLCRSGVVADRLVAGEPTTFGVSGYLYHENLVLYDRRTESLWSQLLATAIRGPRTGDELRLRPSTLTSWRAWREAHPDTAVLLPAPLSDTVAGAVHPPYGIDYYERKAEVQEAFDLGGPDAGTLPDRMLVYGVAHDGAATAYAYPDVKTAGLVNDVVGGLPVVVTLAGRQLVAYVGRVDGRTLTFEADPLRAGGSRFDSVTGRAVSGPLEGTRLEPAPGTGSTYWFAWKAFHPDTAVYGR